MNHTLTAVGLATATLLTCSTAFAQSCPNWSAKFDKVTNRQVLAGLRSTNWDQAIAAAGGPEAIIASSEVTLKDAQNRLKIARDAAKATSATADDPVDNVSWDDCKSPQGANLAAKCEYLNMSELILTLEGTIELAQCRQDH